MHTVSIEGDLHGFTTINLWRQGVFVIHPAQILHSHPCMDLGIDDIQVFSISYTYRWLMHGGIK